MSESAVDEMLHWADPEGSGQVNYEGKCLVHLDRYT